MDYGKWSQSAEDQLKIRAKKTIRQRQQRAKNELAENASENVNASVDKEKDIGDSFKSQQRLGKAVQKRNESIPKSPSQFLQVVAKVAQQMSHRKCRSVLEVSDHLVKWTKVEKRKER